MFTHARRMPPWHVWQRLVRAGGDLVLRSGYTELDGPVDVLNRVYAFTRRHVERFFELLPVIRCRDLRSLQYGDGIVLSFAGSRRPWCRDLGEWEDCLSSDDPDVALWKQPGFEPQRANIYAALRNHMRATAYPAWFDT